MSINLKLINRIKSDLQDLVEQAQDLTIPELVDFEFHLRHIKDFVEKAEKPLSENIKAYGIERRIKVVNGFVYEGHITHVNKTLLDNERVKSFLGVRLPDYQRHNEEIHLKIKQRFSS